MKIAVALEYYNPEGGGAERSAHQIVESLALRGHEVTVFAGKCPEHLLRANGHHPDNHMDDDTSQAYVQDVAPPGAEALSVLGPKGGRKVRSTGCRSAL